MGSVRKLALFVVIGLVVISTAITVYTAAEPGRRSDETSEQGGLSIERASSLYITYCLSCHGPAGLGSAEEIPGVDYRRPGAVLNQNALYSEEQKENAAVLFQSDDPVEQAIAEDWIRFRIMYGIPAEEQVKLNPEAPILMPSFRNDLNVEQINDLVWLIMHGDWNYVYNEAVHYTGVAACEATPEANREESCDEAVAYPTPPPPVNAEEDASEEAAPEDSGAAEEASEDVNTGEVDAVASPDAGADGEEAAAGNDHAVTSTDNAYDTDAITVQPGDTITLTNEGFAQHDFAVDELGIDSDLLNNGQSTTITIPEDAEPGDYEFYCSVPGHKELGMVGTLTVEAP